MPLFKTTLIRTSTIEATTRARGVAHALQKFEAGDYKEDPDTIFYDDNEEIGDIEKVE
jgi:hypothetical protein